MEGRRRREEEKKEAERGAECNKQNYIGDKRTTRHSFQIEVDSEKKSKRLEGIEKERRSLL